MSEPVNEIVNAEPFAKHVGRTDLRF